MAQKLREQGILAEDLSSVTAPMAHQRLSLQFKGHLSCTPNALHSRVCTHIHTERYIFIHTCTHTYPHTDTYKDTHKDIHRCTYTHTYIHGDTYT